MKYKICVVTGSRADYGLLRNLMREIKADTNLLLQIIAIGTHHSADHGFTYLEIENDGFIIDSKIHSVLESDSPTRMSTEIGNTIRICALEYTKLQPNLVVVLGDRYEILAATIAAFTLDIPIAHIHGGEVTIGSKDDSFRHAITKFSNIHFVANETYRKRIIQLGESPSSVYTVGGMGVDNIAQTKLLNRSELENKLGTNLDTKNLLFTFHPSTSKLETPELLIDGILTDLTHLIDTKIFFTIPNSDPGGNFLAKRFRDFVENYSNAFLIESMGYQTYLSCISLFDGVIGNSSSGIMEAPTLKTGTINIGNRQSGRLFASSIIQCDLDQLEFSKALGRLFSEEFQDSLAKTVNPYGNPGAAKTILQIIKSNIGKFESEKIFSDVDFDWE